MAQKIFLRIGAWYKAFNKQLPSDIDMTEIIADVNAEYPVIKDSIGVTAPTPTTPTLDEVMAQGSTLSTDRVIEMNGKSLNVTQGGGDILFEIDTVHSNIFMQGVNGVAYSRLAAMADPELSINFSLSSFDGATLVGVNGLPSAGTVNVTAPSGLLSSGSLVLAQDKVVSMHSPNGNVWLVSVSNAGAIVVTAG